MDLPIKMALTTKTKDESTESICLTTAMWETLEKESLMGYRVFTRGIWYALTIFSCFGLLIYGKQVLFYPIRFGVATFFVAMLLRCLLLVERPIPNSPVLKYIRFMISLIILTFMFYVPFKYPNMDVFISILSLLAGGISIYQLSCTMDIGHALLLLFLAFGIGFLAIDFASQNHHPFSGVYLIFFFQYVIYAYNFNFLANVT
ncbi:unnamed protein product [Eruca vesicaria subsp. sativa]|uniref:Uncharacterized protein n=1 Tax=Eruca vesicaria subsp. sativa TaxID=29727 RepID=A0ABC8LLV5_ERUVS|nr:unnamed protein product [Eruca vesicaria subsp. sativa]